LGCVERETIYRSYTLLFDQIPNLKNCFTSYHPRRLQTDKHLPPGPYTGQF
jgi:hypothetical protein